MTEKIKELIEKINQEGIQRAEEKSRQILEAAQQKTHDLLNKTRFDSEEIVKRAHKEALNNSENQKALLKQAGRDFLLVLRQEINAMLEKLILNDVRQVMDKEALFKCISAVIKESSLSKADEITISMNEEMLCKFQESFLEKLKQEVKKEIVLRPQEDIRAGFIISYDAGRSQFDYSDKALAEYISVFLKPKLTDIFKD